MYQLGRVVLPGECQRFLKTHRQHRVDWQQLAALATNHIDCFNVILAVPNQKWLRESKLGNPTSP
jgi:hypothetical protein